MKIDQHELGFAELMDRVRGGSQEAAWEIIDRFGPQIQRVIRRFLDIRLRSQFDSADFVQHVWLSFFRHPEVIRKFNSPQELAAYLMIMARNKVTDETRRRLKTQKYDVRRVRSYDDRDMQGSALTDRSPTPSAIVSARERWEQLIKGQPRHYQEVARLRFLGESTTDIAQKLKINERTVRKIMDHLFQSPSNGD